MKGTNIKKSFVSKNVLILAIVVIALFLRLYGINWDQGQHLHPDERFLTMVTAAASMPKTIVQYLDPSVSPLNPYNLGYGFFVYGALPLTVVKSMVHFTGMDDYNSIVLLGRVVSALLDVGALIFIYKIALLIQKRAGLHGSVPVLTAFLYSVSVFPIQQSHFFTADSFAHFFTLGAIFFALSFLIMRKEKSLVLSSILFGLGIASKISVIYVLPLILGFIVLRGVKVKRGILMKTAGHLLIFGLISYLVLRLGDPRLFASSFFLDPRPNPQFIDNIKQLRALSSPDVWFPPSVQWIGKTPISPLINLAIFGLGPIYFLISLIGVFYLSIKKIRFNKSKWVLLLLFVWFICFFIYQSLQFGKTMRYFYVLYPFLAFFAGVGMVWVFVKSRIIGTILFASMLIWPISFMAIYTRPHSRVGASYWIHQNIKQGSILAQEYWDDILPLSIPGIPLRKYRIDQMPVFEQDTDQKWEKINKSLSKADYIILTSNRGYGSIGSVPKRYPKMSRFYQDLFEGRLEFKKIKEFVSYPAFPPFCSSKSLFCYIIDDQWAEEAFTVYDHPKVTIFKKM